MPSSSSSFPFCGARRAETRSSAAAGTGRPPAGGSALRLPTGKEGWRWENKQMRCGWRAEPLSGASGAVPTLKLVCHWRLGSPSQGAGGDSEAGSPRPEL